MRIRLAELCGVLATWLLVTGCGARGPAAPQVMAVAPITAAAPRGIDDSSLGTPVDMHFRPLQGAVGKSIFPDARVRRMPQTYVSHDAFVVRDAMSLEANLSAWAVIDATLAHRSDSRYATYRAFQVVGISAIDDQVDPAAPPLEAVFYVSKIHWGHAYEAVFEGDRRSLNAAVAANFPPVGVSVGAFAASNNLRAHFTGLGLRPKRGDALFARSERDILDAYDTLGPPAPILVEYRPVPNRPVPTNTAILIDVALRVMVRFENVRVIEDGSWGSTPWTLQASCNVGGGPRTPTVPLLKGDRVEGGRDYSLNQTVELVAAPGDTLECAAEGSFADAIAHGTVAPGRSSPVPLSGAGSQPLTVEGRGKGSYRITATVQVQPFN